MKVLVTGGAGFIGSAFVRVLLHDADTTVINVDNLTYAGSRFSVSQLEAQPRHCFEKGDICDTRFVTEVLQTHCPDAIVHLAAESHVDRSIDAPADFIRSNVIGTYSMLEATLGYWDHLKGEAREGFRFHHVSTDEVYGSLDLGDPPFEESTAYAPNSPYAASKAASDHLVLAWRKTYGLPVLLSNCTNNYGPFQFPEKLIPLTIDKAIHGEPIPVYGAGENVRDWIFVEDHVEALHLVLKQGRVGERYNVSAGCERTNIDVVHTICRLLDDLMPNDPVVPHADLIHFVKDRPGHDLRYAMTARKLHQELGWTPSTPFEEGLVRTLKWYLDNTEWCDAIRDQSYAGERLGTRGKSPLLA